MDEQQIFEYLKDNLRVSFDDYPETDYGNSYQVVKLKLFLTNPETKKDEVISSDSFTIDK